MPGSPGSPAVRLVMDVAVALWSACCSSPCGCGLQWEVGSGTFLCPVPHRVVGVGPRMLSPKEAAPGCLSSGLVCQLHLQHHPLCQSIALPLEQEAPSLKTPVVALCQQR